MRLGSRHASAVLAACAIALCACGGGGSDDDGAAYVAKVNEAQQDFATRVDKLSEGITATSSAASDRETLQAFEDAVGRVGGELRAIRPPGEVRDLHSELVGAVDAYGDDVEAATKALRSKSPARLRAAQQRLAQETTAFGTTLNETIDRINKEISG